MPEPERVTKLRAFPRSRLIERELFACTVSEVDLLEALGAPSAESQPGLGEGHPNLYWDLVWSCGMVMGLQFDQLEQRLVGFLDEPEVEHALWHIGIKPDQLWVLERDDPEHFAVVCDPVARNYELWLGAEGEEVRLLTRLTKREAECRRSWYAERATDGRTYVVRSTEPAIDLGSGGSKEEQVPAGEPLTEPSAAPERVRQALIERAASTLSRRTAAADETTTDDLPVAPTSGGLEGFDDDDFRPGRLLDP
ncbi:MAG: hypothetical protein N2037_13465 [Acidimicrobiales bacterium]|nr:hypothetical protein [Acidimicrobiales bacterium]